MEAIITRRSWCASMAGAGLTSAFFGLKQKTLQVKESWTPTSFFGRAAHNYEVTVTINQPPQWKEIGKSLGVTNSRQWLVYGSDYRFPAHTSLFVGCLWEPIFSQLGQEWSKLTLKFVCGDAVKELSMHYGSEDFRRLLAG